MSLAALLSRILPSSDLVPSPVYVASVAVHMECFIRSVVGSVGHQMQQCHCYGGTVDDPPNMSKREAARAAYRLSELMGRVARGQVTRGHDC
jgi:hypothetical protein